MSLEGILRCLFTAKLQLSSEGLYYEPSAKEFLGELDKVLTWFRDCVMARPNLLADRHFFSFTRYNKPMGSNVPIYC